MPNLHDWLAPSFSILIFAYRPLVLVSTLFVDDVIVKGLNVVAVSVCCGNLFTDMVILASPTRFLKSGSILRINKKNWPDVKWGEPIEGVLVLDPMAEMFVAGCTVDYVNELGGSYLKVVNPNAVASCGCGESFAV